MEQKRLRAGIISSCQAWAAPTTAKPPNQVLYVLHVNNTNNSNTNNSIFYLTLPPVSTFKAVYMHTPYEFPFSLYLAILLQDSNLQKHIHVPKLANSG